MLLLRSSTATWTWKRFMEVLLGIFRYGSIAGATDKRSRSGPSSVEPTILEPAEVLARSFATARRALHWLCLQFSSRSPFTLRHRRTGDIAAAALTAVFGQVGDQPVHRGIVGAVIDEAPGLLGCNQIRMAQLLQMEGEGCRCDVQCLAYLPCSKSLRARLHEQTEDGETRLLRQGCQCRDRVFGGARHFHNS